LIDYSLARKRLPSRPSDGVDRDGAVVNDVFRETNKGHALSAVRLLQWIIRVESWYVRRCPAGHLRTSQQSGSTGRTCYRMERRVKV